MKPLKALNFLLSSKNLFGKTHHDKSKSLVGNEINSQKKNLTVNEKYLMKNSSNLCTTEQNYLNINTEKDEFFLINPSNDVSEIQFDKNNKILKNITTLFDSFKEIGKKIEIIKNIQTNFMNFMDLKFKNIDVLFQTLLPKNKTLRKKYEEIAFSSKFSEMNIINCIFHSLEIAGNAVSSKRLDEIKREILQEFEKIANDYEKIKQNYTEKTKEENNNNNSHKNEKNENNDKNEKAFTEETNTDEPIKTKQKGTKKRKYKLSQSIQNLDKNFKKKFLFSIQEKLKASQQNSAAYFISKQQNIKITDEISENIPENNESPKIKINTPKSLQNAFSFYEKEKQQPFANILNEKINEVDLLPTSPYMSEKEGFTTEKDKKNFFTPAQEKKIILELLHKENNNKRNEDNLFILQSECGKEHQVKFIINAKWWRSWISYVNSDRKMYPGEIINRFFYNKFLIYHTFYNVFFQRDLITEDFFTNDNVIKKRICLKENILEHHDYETVSKNIFRYLKKWYGVDYEIVRLLKKDPLDEKKVYLDLYPEKHYVSKNVSKLKNNRSRNYSEEDRYPRTCQTNQSLTLNTMNDFPSNELRLCISNSSVRLDTIGIKTTLIY